MKKIKILARTAYTVTIHRRDFAALVLAASPKKKPTRAARFSAADLKRMRKGTSPVRIWRERRGINQRALADAAEIGVSYLAEIEGGKKPGSAAALSRLADALGVRMEDLVRP